MAERRNAPLRRGRLGTSYAHDVDLRYAREARGKESLHELVRRARMQHRERAHRVLIQHQRDRRLRRRAQHVRPDAAVEARRTL